MNTFLLKPNRAANELTRQATPVVALGSLVFALAWFSGCSRPPKADPDLVAKIGNREIRVAEFQDWMRRRGVGTNAVQKEALLQEMFDHFAAVQKAQDLGLDQDPELRRSWENMLVAKLRDRQLEPQLARVTPTSAQLEAYYETNLASFTEPALRRGAILFVEFPTKASDEQKAHARGRLSEARAKALEQAKADSAARGFGALAVEYSEDPLTRYKGGDLGWLTEGKPDNRFDKAVLDTLFSLEQTNALSEIIQTPRGCYLVKWLDARPRRVKPLDAVQPVIQHRLLLENRQQLEAEWRRGLRSNCPSEVFPEPFARVTAPSGPIESTASAPPLPP